MAAPCRKRSSWRWLFTVIAWVAVCVSAAQAAAPPARAAAAARARDGHDSGPTVDEEVAVLTELERYLIDHSSGKIIDTPAKDGQPEEVRDGAGLRKAAGAGSKCPAGVLQCTVLSPGKHAKKCPPGVLGCTGPLLYGTNADSSYVMSGDRGDDVGNPSAPLFSPQQRTAAKAAAAKEVAAFAKASAALQKQQAAQMIKDLKASGSLPPPPTPKPTATSNPHGKRRAVAKRRGRHAKRAGKHAAHKHAAKHRMQQQQAMGPPAPAPGAAPAAPAPAAAAAKPHPGGLTLVKPTASAAPKLMDRKVKGFDPKQQIKPGGGMQEGPPKHTMKNLLGATIFSFNQEQRDYVRLVPHQVPGASYDDPPVYAIVPLSQQNNMVHGIQGGYPRTPYTKGQGIGSDPIHHRIPGSFNAWH